MSKQNIPAAFFQPALVLYTRIAALQSPLLTYKGYSLFHAFAISIYATTVPCFCSCPPFPKLLRFHAQSSNIHNFIAQDSLSRLGSNHRRRCLLLLLLVLNLLHIVLWHIVFLHHPVEHLIAHIALHRDLLAAASRLRHARARRELLAELLRRLLQIDVEVLQPGDLGDVLALVALHALDDDLARRALLALAGFRRLRFGGLLLCVFLRALLGVDAQAGEVLRERFGRVQRGVERRVCFFEPFGAFLGRAAKFTVLENGQLVNRGLL